MNRSGLVTALILIRDRIKAEEAIALIRQKRSGDALSNLSFVEYLTRQI
jgi:protein-tyrosine phosphatase